MMPRWSLTHLKIWLAQALQIQTLTTNVEELTRQNQEMGLQLQYEENREANRNVDEENSNKRDGSRETNLSDRASNDLLKSMRKEMDELRNEMDELRNEMREKTNKNLDGIVRRIDSPFTIKVLKCPLSPKFHLPQLKSFDDL